MPESEAPVPELQPPSTQPPGRRRRTGAFRRMGRGVLRATELALHPRTSWGRAWRRTRRVVFGRPLATVEETRERLSKPRGFGMLASGNLSSSAYASEEIMRILLLGGAAALALTMPITLAVVFVLVLVVASYTKVITAYPGGGGSYAAAKENLGTLPGLVAAAALFSDYVLTVSVSVSAGVAAVTSVVPDLFPWRVPLALGVIVFLTIGNLRGVRESGAMFSAPTYLFIVSLLGLLAYGMFRWWTGTLPPPPADAATGGTVSELAALAGPLLVLRAFAAGAVALTGVEAVSNGVPAFEKPEARNARTVLVAMGVLLAVLFVGISFLAVQMAVRPPASEQETLLSVVTRSLVGSGAFYVIVQGSTAVLLLLAANTSFTGFPRLNRNLAADRFMPKTFAERGERLAFSTGIVMLAALAGLLVVVFSASVTRLVPLYTVGVFVAFTLSQAGMVVHWWRTQERGWHWWAALNGCGAAATGLVAIEVATVKFVHGAWVVLLLIPLFVLAMLRTKRHFLGVRRELHLPDPHAEMPLSAKPDLVIMPVTRVDKATIRALAYAQSISENVVAVHVTESSERAAALRASWPTWAGSTPLVVIESPFRKVVAPLVAYIDELDQNDPGRPITVVVPSFIPRKPWHFLLHSHTAERLRVALRLRPNTVVTSVPFHLRG